LPPTDLAAALAACIALFLSSLWTAAAGAAGSSAYGPSGTASGAGFGASLLQALNNSTARLAMAMESASFIYSPED
jgi:hypothetical protein